MARNAYNTKGRLSNALARLEKNGDVASGARKAIRALVEDLASQGLSVHRQVWYINNLLPVAEALGSRFMDPSEKEVKAYLAGVERRDDFSDWSKADRKVAVKRFYKWLLGNDEEYPPAVRWVRTTVPNHKRKLPEDLLTREEVVALIDGAITSRDKALIALLADGGLRIGEALDLRVRDFHADEYGGYLMVPSGKTGARRVRLIDSVPYISAWLRDHPRREDGDAPFFLQLGRNRGVSLRYAAARKAIRSAAKRGGVDPSKVNPHNFRHTRATVLARKVPEAPLEAQMGWVPGSSMSKVYVHLSGRDVDEAILRSHGIDVNGEGEEAPKVPRKCPRCQTSNVPEARFCQGCGMALSEEAARQADAATERVMGSLMEIARDPERAAHLRELLEREGA